MSVPRRHVSRSRAGLRADVGAHDGLQPGARRELPARALQGLCIRFHQIFDKAKAWGQLSEHFELETLFAGHMDCLQMKAPAFKSLLKNLKRAQAAELPADIQLELPCYILEKARGRIAVWRCAQTPEMMRTVRNFAQAPPKTDKNSCFVMLLVEF